MGTKEKALLKCLVLLPSEGKSSTLGRILQMAGQEAGVEVYFQDEAEAHSIKLIEIVYSQISQADLVIAEISNNNRNVFYEIGIAHALGKPTFTLAERGSQFTFDISIPPTNPVIPYTSTSEGLIKLRIQLVKLLKDFKRFPQRFKSLTPFSSSISSSQTVIDLSRLEPREFENLCFELFNQLGFRQVDWGKEFHEIDMVATLPRKDPDGFEFQELWLIFIGLSAPIEVLIDMATHNPGYLIDRLLKTKVAQFLNIPFKHDTPITLLFLLNKDRLPQSIIQRSSQRIEKFYNEELSSLTYRMRYWDKQQLTNLIKQFPQLTYKYFSEEGRAQSRYRKTAEELYHENVELNQRLQATLHAYEEEKDKRIRAERDAIWKELSFTSAHKLGNPIFALETDLQGLKKRITETPSEAINISEEMGKSIEKAKLIIEQFKSLTKAQEISPQPIDILPLIQNACRVARAQNVDTQIHSPSRLPKVLVDPDKIVDSFDELVTNSLRWFNKPAKKITITVDIPKPKELPKELNQSQEYLRVIFEDNGCGVQAAMKDRIFQPFVTTHPHGDLLPGNRTK